MKKIVLTVVAMLSLTFAHAEDEKVNMVNRIQAYNMHVNYDRLAQSLGLTMDQKEAVEDIHRTFIIEMRNAGEAPNDERPEMVKKAVYRDLQNMQVVLNKEQYKKYNAILNATLNNRGLTVK